jgi:Flp pilus assembly secretin CpaC
MNHRRIKSIRSVAGAIAVALMMSAAFAAAQEAARQESINISAGQSTVIGHLSKDVLPAIEVLDNPHALVVHGEVPGELAIMGAERGRWKITATRDDGTVIDYLVNVNAVRDEKNPLAAGSAPAAMAEVGSADSLPTSVMPDESAAAGSIPVAAAVAAPVAVDRPGASTTAAAAPREAQPPVLPPPAVAPASVARSQALPVITQQAPPAGRATQYRSDPSLLESGEAYMSPSVSGGPNYLPPDGLLLMTGTSQIVDFVRKMKRISIADSSIADVQVTGPYQLNLIARKPGFTTLAIWDVQGHYEERQVRVDQSGKQQVLLNSLVAELNRSALENQGINYSVALAHYGVTLMGLPGAVGTPYSAQGSSSGGNTPISLTPGGTIMPLLLSQNITYGLAAQNSNVLTQTFFQFLEQHNLARVLAQPQLLANSGEEAKFLSGGEIPIVIAQALNTSIVFKQFGTQVQFVPTVIGSSEVELQVKTEVSQPDYAHGVQLFGFNVPAFISRRAETMVRLRDNQTLIIAGLILHDKRETIQKVPYLGDIPYAGGLFRNTTWQDTESDLVMAVTPQLIHPLPAQGKVFVAARRGPLSSYEIGTRRTAIPDAGRPRF